MMKFDKIGTKLKHQNNNYSIKQNLYVSGIKILKLV